MCFGAKTTSWNEEVNPVLFPLTYFRWTGIGCDTRRMSGNCLGGVLIRPYLEVARFIIALAHDLLMWILSLSDTSERIDRWRLRLSTLDRNVVYRNRVKHEVAEAQSRLRTDGENKIDFDVGLFVCNVKNTQKADIEISYMHICMECNVETELTTGNSDGDRIQ